MGLLATGTSCLALVCVMGRRRVPLPPARTSAFMRPPCRRGNEWCRPSELLPVAHDGFENRPCLADDFVERAVELAAHLRRGVLAPAFHAQALAQGARDLAGRHAR